MRNISITEKLILYILLLGIGAIIIIGFYSYNNARRALMIRTFDQLTSVRNVRKNQVENFFRDRIRDIDLISKTKEVTGYQFPHSSRKSTVSGVRFSFLKYLNSGNYYRKFMICDSSGSALIINTTSKDTAAFVAKLSDSDIAIKQLLAKIKATKNVIIQDYLSEQPSLYIGTPLLNKHDNIEGSVILEISDDAINKIMLESSPENGLGVSGESYLVGNDYLMRSRSRFIKNSFLKTKVKTEGAIGAFTHGEGSSVILDYRSIPVLSSYRKLNISELNWVILAEIDLKEAMIPIYAIRNNILVYMIIIAIFLFIFAYLISKKITKPIIRLKEATKDIAKGNFDVELNPGSNDEIGELTSSFNEMTKRLKRQTEELREKDEKRLSFMIDGQEIERHRLSRELHDGLGQSLIAIKLMLESTEDVDINKTKKTINSVKTLFDNTINEVRRISDNLMPAVLQEFGLKNALRNLCDGVSELSGINIKFEAKNLPDTFSDRIKKYIFRIIQEVLNNIVKHAHATNAEVLINIESGYLYLNITDDGIGFNINDAGLKNGNGLNNLRERVNLLHGNISINSEINHGTDITIKIPVNY